MIIDRSTGGLHDKDIHSPDILPDLDEDFAITEFPHLRLGQGQVEVCGNIKGQIFMGVS